MKDDEGDRDVCACAERGFCPRYGMKMSPKMYQICQGDLVTPERRAEYCSAWMRGASAKSESAEKPSLGDKVGTLAKAMGRFVADGAKTVSENDYTARLTVCYGCDLLNGKTCSACGCLVTLKAKMRLEDCPKGKWPKVVEPVVEAKKPATKAKLKKKVKRAVHVPKRKRSDSTQPKSGQPYDIMNDDDWTRMRHARDRHSGFHVGKYLQSAPMVFTRDGHAVYVADMYRGASAFLCLSGPSLGDLPCGDLASSGVLTMAVNNAATLVRPHLWMSVDNPTHFVEQIWADAGIMKFVPLCHSEKTLLVRDKDDRLVKSKSKVGDMPATFFFRRNEQFKSKQWLWEDTFNWGCHSSWKDETGNQGGRMVMYPAIRMLFYLGVRRIYLLGCDFEMTKGNPYAFRQVAWDSKIAGNSSSYRMACKRFAVLKPHFEEAGLEVFNCNENSGLKVFPHVPFDRAIEEARGVCAVRPNTYGHYEVDRK